MASRIYRHFKKTLLSGLINLEQDTIKVMLLSGTYNGGTDSNSRTHTVTGDISASYEVVGTAYVKGGAALASKTIGVGAPAGDDEAYFDAADITWSSSTITASGAVLYKSGSTAANSYLIAYLDFGANQTSSNGSFTISWNSQGIYNLE